ncbi:MAG: hypothetical protein HY769_10745 [Candidatus Stahlbacteria bacterium]|nr:hypothetical protein [Candidatus Stahlbacteria bacterium]
MARYGTSGLFAWIRGSMGGLTFSSIRGVPYVKQKIKKTRNANTKEQCRARHFFKLLNEGWSDLSPQEMAIWESYARSRVKTSMVKKNSSWKGRGTGSNAFVSLNHLLLTCGFDKLMLPPSKYIHIPPVCKTSLVDKGVYKGEVRFTVWLPYQYESDCVCQVWLRKMQKASYFYIGAIVPLTTEPAEVLIDKVRVFKEGRTSERNLNTLPNLKLFLQLRTVARNGKFSLPTHIYRITVKNT